MLLIERGLDYSSYCDVLFNQILLNLHCLHYKFNFRLASTHTASATILPELVPEDT